MQVRLFVCAGFVGLSVAALAVAADRGTDIRELGAVGDGKTLCTAAIQNAIDRCASTGGGTVYLPPGRWLSGTIYLKSHVTLYLEAGCTLLGSTKPTDYPENVATKTRSYTDIYVRQSLITGEDLDNVAIRGRGTIDGQGGQFRWKGYKDRPYVIRLVGCRDVLVEDVHLRDSAMWMQHYLACQRVTLRGVRVFNHASYNADGLDLDGCRDVTISDCVIDSDDDALCLKSTSPHGCENVCITNCVLSSHCNALKMGTETTGGFKNITVTNCAICSPRYSKPTYGIQRGRGGIALEIVDGGHMDRVTVSNITIDGVSSPIFLRLGNRARPYQKDAPKPPVGTLRNVVLSNIVATNAWKTGCPIAGIPGHRIQNVTLRDIRLEFEGGGTKDDAARKIEEREAVYPESSMFGILPAYGLYCRHVEGLRLNNVQLAVTKPDARPALAFEDVEDVLVDGRAP